METIRKESVHSYENGDIWDTSFNTYNKEDGTWLLITQENRQDGNESDVAINEIELNAKEMLVLYWHLQVVLEKD